MHRHLVLLAVVLVVTVGLSACAGGAEAPPEDGGVAPPSSGRTLTLADVSDSPGKKIAAYQPLADYLAAELAEAGFVQGRVRIAPDLETIGRLLESGDVDLYFDSPYPVLTVFEDAGAFPLARRWKKGVAEYHTKIVVRRDSGITHLDGLVGQIVAFGDVVSTSGYLLPKAHLMSNGYGVTEVGSAAGSVAAGQIGYVFAGDEENVLAWVLDGKTAGGTLASDDYENLDDASRSQLLVLAETAAVPRHIAMASPAMDEELRERITELLLGLHTSPEGQAILETFERTVQFDALPHGADGAMAALQQIFAPVR